MIIVPDEIKNELNNLRLPAFVSSAQDKGISIFILILIETEDSGKGG